MSEPKYKVGDEVVVDGKDLIIHPVKLRVVNIIPGSKLSPKSGYLLEPVLPIAILSKNESDLDDIVTEHYTLTKVDNDKE